jgi:branched-chain amino acid aminotransferase
VKSDYIWMNGKLVPFNDANVHILTPAIHYGLAIFEGIRCYNTDKGPAIFRLQEHLKRFKDSAHAFGILDFNYTVDELRDAVHKTILANKFSECYIRPLLYMGDGPLGLNLDNKHPLVSIATWKWGNLLGEEKLASGVRLTVSSVTRMHPNANLTKAKVAGNYVNSVVAKTLATRMGFDEAVMLDANGMVAECTGENLFLVRDGKIYTSPKANILEGITRDSVISLAGDLNIPVIEEQITRDQLYISDEVFVCGTAAEVVPVREIDFRTIGAGKMGPITKQIQQLFFKTARGQAEHAEWLDIVES